MPDSPTTPKDAALRAVGRTFVNFQRLEHNLKLAARLGPLAGHLPKIQRDIERRVERAATLTLGQAIQSWLFAADGEPPVTNFTPDLFDVTVQATITIGDAEARREHGIALKSLLEARNRLVHGGLVHFDWDSPEECWRLVSELDEMNHVIRQQIDFMASILRAIDAIRLEDVEIAAEDLGRMAVPTTKTAGDA